MEKVKLQELSFIYLLLFGLPSLPIQNTSLTGSISAAETEV